MRLSNKIFYKLGDVDTKVPMKGKLQKCLDLDIPVLVKVPVEYNVWAIDPQLDKITKKDVILSENNYYDKIELMHHFINDDKFQRHDQPKINTSSMLASTLVADVEFVQLFRCDIKKLTISEEVAVVQFQRVGIIDENDFTLKQSLSVSRYRFKLDGFDVDTDENTFLDLFDQKVKFEGDNLNFVFCDKQLSSKNDFNFPIGNEQKLSVSALECYVKEEYVSQLVFDEVDYRDSSYHLEPEYHASSAFLQLSKAGYDLFVKKVPVSSGGNSGYLMRNFSSFKKKGWFEAGVFLIKGKGSNFKTAKEVYNNCWLPKNKLSRKKIQETIENVIVELDQRMVTNDAYVRSIELIIRPDKYK